MVSSEESEMLSQEFLEIAKASHFDEDYKSILLNEKVKDFGLSAFLQGIQTQRRVQGVTVRSQLEIEQVIADLELKLNNGGEYDSYDHTSFFAQIMILKWVLDIDK